MFSFVPLIEWKLIEFLTLRIITTIRQNTEIAIVVQVVSLALSLWVTIVCISPGKLKFTRRNIMSRYIRFPSRKMFSKLWPNSSEIYSLAQAYRRSSIKTKRLINFHRLFFIFTEIRNLKRTLEIKNFVSILWQTMFDSKIEPMKIFINSVFNFICICIVKINEKILLFRLVDLKVIVFFIFFIPIKINKLYHKITFFCINLTILLVGYP